MTLCLVGDEYYDGYDGYVRERRYSNMALSPFRSIILVSSMTTTFSTAAVLRHPLLRKPESSKRCIRPRAARRRGFAARSRRVGNPTSCTCLACLACLAWTVYGWHWLAAAGCCWAGMRRSRDPGSCPCVGCRVTDAGHAAGHTICKRMAGWLVTQPPLTVDSVFVAVW